jgi:8-amino-3,8-dideoxy-alpha-D-manno-octulosonate transaminase
MTQPTSPSPVEFRWPQEFPGVHWIDAQEEQALLDVVRHGSLFRYYGIGQPRHVDALEAAAREFYGVKHALAVNSGTGALTCAMAALGVGPGCEVVIPAFLWVASVGAVVQSGAIPVVCEVDRSFNLDPVALERCLTPRTAAIVAIHMAGAPCDMDAILRVADRHGVPVLEDCAQANGGSYRGRRLGSLGRMAIFSLQLNKNITCGEGGLVVTNDDRLFERAFSAHDMGMVRKNGRLAQPEDYALSWGQGRRMSELAGAVATVQMGKLPGIVARMNASKRRIKTLLAGTPGLAFRTIHDEAGDAGPFIIMILDTPALAQRLFQRLRAGGFGNAMLLSDYGLHVYSNIAALVRKVPLSPCGHPWNHPDNAASSYRYDLGACPQSDALFARSVLLPVPSNLSPDLEHHAAAFIRRALSTD